MTLNIHLKNQPDVPLEVEGIVPNRMSGLSCSDVASQTVYHGNEEVQLGDFFTVDGDPTDQTICWHGELSKVHWIGAKMESGVVHIMGNAGRHIGSEMSGGEIHVAGDAGDWAGGEMQRGLISVKGRAGHLVGAAYRGSQRGMTGGTILVGGNVGNEVGHTMRRGTIAVGGNAGDLAGFNMIAGSILVFGGGGIRHGAGMRRGTIGFFGNESPKPLPTFRYGCQYSPPMLGLLFAELRQHEFTIPERLELGSFALYHGDLIEGGRGEMIVRSTG